MLRSDVMFCGSCGGRKTQTSTTSAFNPTWVESPRPNERRIYTLSGDDPDCSGYRGIFQGSTMFLVGYQTEHEKLFLVSQRVAAWNYAVEHKVPLLHISVIQLCDARVREMFGEDAPVATS